MSEWISVDRLPETNLPLDRYSDDLLIWGPKQDITIACFDFAIGDWFISYNKTLSWDDITHWQPLPDPPE